MIRAQMITEHGAKKQDGVQIDIRGELGKVLYEQKALLKEMYNMIDAMTEEDGRQGAMNELGDMMAEMLQKIAIEIDEKEMEKAIREDGKDE